MAKRVAKKEYRFDQETLTYRVVKPPLQLRVYRILRKVLIGFLLASVFNFLFSYFFYTPKMYNINSRNRELRMQYGLLEEKIGAATKKMHEIKHRDQAVYRSLFGADTMAIPEAYLPYSAPRYADLRPGSYTPIVTHAWEGLDRLAGLIYLESLSLDQLQVLSVDKEKMAAAIPAIWPIDKRALKHRIGAFGGRNHPILGRYLMHTGIDLAANTGTKVYATANGKVVANSGQGSGYGLQVLVNHGYGYQTRYAHLSRILVSPGQEVRRGDIIGEVGSTGRSTGPHLHYEVIYRGRHVDPINYIRKDMTAAEMENITKSLEPTTFEAY